MGIDSWMSFYTFVTTADAGCADITTRSNIKLRGVSLAEADKICEGLEMSASPPSPQVLHSLETLGADI